MILVEDLSRLTRDTAELLRTNARLRLRGVEIVGVSDGVASNAKGAKLLLTVKGAMNEVYLDDLREKTHRDLQGSHTRGLSTGGRTFGYRAVKVEGAARPGKHSQPARLEIDEAEAAIVRRIFEEYRDGKSLRAIAVALNDAGVPFPAKGTRRERVRKGWSRVTVRWILRNERYVGRVIWNKRQWVKDPDTGTRRYLLRPKAEWATAEQPELRIVPDTLWRAVAARIRMIEERYEGAGRRGIRRGAASLYSAHLLNGLLRCAACGGRMEIITTTRQKNRQTYAQRWYVCSDARNKGPAICDHSARYRADLLEADLIERFRAATTPSSTASPPP